MYFHKKENFAYAIYAIILFFTMYVFYTVAEPLMVCDPDDWTYIGVIRKAYPIWKDWNPTKILPETLEGFLGYFAAYVIYPICGDYIKSFTYVFACFVSIMITLYMISITLFLNQCIGIGRMASILSSLITFFLHFLILTGNLFLFTASNLNCFMNYLVPLLFNAVIFMYFMIRAKGKRQNYFVCSKEHKSAVDYIKLGGLLLLIYLAVFSNMVCNIVFIIPTILLFLYGMIRELSQAGYRTILNSQYLKRHFLYFYMIALEIICLFFEYNGGRAGSFNNDFFASLAETKEDILSVVQHLNKGVLFLIVAVSIVTLVMCCKTQNNKCFKILVLLSVSAVFIFIYMVLLYTRIGDHKIQRCENIFVLLIFVMLIFSVSLGYLLEHWHKSLIAVPILLYILAALVLSKNYKPSISYYSGDCRICYAVDTSIVNQYIQAERDELEAFDLHVPETGLGNYSFSADRISLTLYRHGITNKLLKANMLLEDIEYFLK